jgi:hypothetical protein
MLMDVMGYLKTVLTCSNKFNQSKIYKSGTESRKLPFEEDGRKV